MMRHRRDVTGAGIPESPGQISTGSIHDGDALAVGRVPQGAPPRRTDGRSTLHIQNFLEPSPNEAFK